MPVESTLARVQYATNGTTGPWTIPFYFLASDHVKVIHTDASGNETTLVLNVGYTVSGAGDESGGSVTTTTAYASGGSVTILRDIEPLQEVDYTETDSFPAETHERALNLLTMLIQQLKEVSDRSLVFSPSDTLGSTLPAAAARANKMLGFNGVGQLTVSVPSPGSAAAVLTQLANSATATENDALLALLRTSTGAVASNWHNWLERSVINPRAEFGVTADGTTNDFAGLQAALNAAGTLGRGVYLPGGTSFCRITDELVVPDGVTVYGDGFASCIKQVTREKNVFSMGSRTELRGLRIQGDGVTTGGLAFQKNNGVSIVGKTHVKILNCWIHGLEHNGIFADDSSNLTIQDNVFYGNAYSSDSGADVVVYSDGGASRFRIAGNWLFSNNSQGVYFCALGKDTDAIISGNISAPLDANWALVTSGNLRKRHGYVLGYNGGSGAGRVICHGNHSYYTRQTGVYWQAGTATEACVIITHNYIRAAGTNALEPSLVAGIFLAAQGRGDVVTNNIITDTGQTGFLNAAGISLLPQAASVPARNGTLIANNGIADSAAHGVYVGANAQNATVVDNQIAGTGLAYIVYSGGAGFTGGGVIRFEGNRCAGMTAAAEGIYLNMANATPVITVRGNELDGFNNTTAATSNAGLFLRNWNPTNPHRFEGNLIRNFYAGASSDQYCDVATKHRFIGNRYHSCNAAYHFASTGAGRLVTQDDELVSTSTYQSPALLSGVRLAWPGLWTQGGGVQVFHNAVPTTGTWAVGDRVQQSVSAVGSPKGWACTVAGYAGTWVSEGNL